MLYLWSPITRRRVVGQVMFGSWYVKQNRRFYPSTAVSRRRK